MAKRGYVDIPEGQVHYRFEGSGEPLLLLHQTPYSSDEYTPMIPILAKGGCWVVAMDTLGYGMSDKPPRPYTIEDYARSIVSFLDALGIKRTSVAGHHTGTSLGIELAASYPERVDKLVLSGCSLYTPEERQAFLSHSQRQPMKLSRDGSFLMENWNSIWASAEANNNPNMTPEIAFRFFVGKMMAGPKLHDAHHAAYRYEKEPKLPLIKSPTLVQYGTLDSFYPKLESVRKLIPRCRVRIIEGAGNQIANEQPEEFAQSILEFLEEQRD